MIHSQFQIPCKDVRTPGEFNIKTVFFRPWKTESRCFSVRLTTATSKKIMYWIREIIVDNSDLSSCFGPCSGTNIQSRKLWFNSRKELLYNFYTSSIFRKILSLFKYGNKNLIFETATLFLEFHHRLSFCNE